MRELTMMMDALENQNVTVNNTGIHILKYRSPFANKYYQYYK
jgi:hypothetical protein